MPSPCVITWLSAFGEALNKGRRQSIEMLDDGGARLVMEYPTLGDLLAAVQEVDALKAMTLEDAAAQRQCEPGALSI